MLTHFPIEMQIKDLLKHFFRLCVRFRPRIPIEDLEKEGLSPERKASIAISSRARRGSSAILVNAFGNRSGDSGWIPLASTRAETSTATSLGRPGMVPLLRTSRTNRSPTSFTRDSMKGTICSSLFSGGNSRNRSASESCASLKISCVLSLTRCK